MESLARKNGKIKTESHSLGWLFYCLLCFLFRKWDIRYGIIYMKVKTKNQGGFVMLSKFVGRSFELFEYCRQCGDVEAGEHFEGIMSVRRDPKEYEV